ncbi:MAG: carbohydrate kinase family protein [Anaerolineae bacterium]|nr:carbohydrate kinase family protein [Anaerolineae bacterium]
MKDNFMLTSMDDWSRLLAQEIALPEAYQQPRGIHLITEFNNEPMVHSALALKEKGAVFSLEPLINHRTWKNRDEIISLLRYADTASPDWPSASGIAGSDDPLKVLKHWSKLGPSLVTVRHGAQGSYVWDNVTDCMWHIPAVPTEVVDPTGAGNCYGGGAFVGWVEHRDGRIAATYGGVSAVFLVRRYGLPPMTKELQQEAQQLLEQALDRSEKL